MTGGLAATPYLSADEKTGQGVPWFLVDDQFHSSSTLRKILATEPAAAGLWTVAGSWSSANLTDGFVPDDVLPWLFPDAPRLAEALVTARAWRRVKGGHKFVPGVTHKIPSRASVERDRESAAERQRRRRKAIPSRRDSPVTHGGGHGVTLDHTDTTNKEPPQPPAPNGAGGDHRGQHKHCRQCGTNQRGPAPEPPPTRMPPPYQAPNGNGRVASEDVADLLAGTRQAIHRGDP